MKINKNNKGSVLLLAIGLLSTMALLGTTFFLTSRANRDLAVAESEKSHQDPIAKGALNRAIALIHADSYKNFTDTTYINETDTVSKWYKYIDSGLNIDAIPATMPNINQIRSLDYYLASRGKSTDFPGGLLIPGNTGTGVIPSSSILNADPSMRGYTIKTGLAIRSINGEYELSATLVDLSSKCNLNIARGKPLNNVSEYLSTSCPAQILLSEVTGASNNIITKLPPATNPLEYQIKVANKFQAQDRNTLASTGSGAFSAAEEYFLRSSGSDGYTKCARLSQCSISDNDKRNLTTYSATRQLQRYPVNAKPTFKYSFPVCDTTGKAYSSAQRANQLYTFFTKSNILYKLGLVQNNSASIAYARQYMSNYLAYTMYNPAKPTEAFRFGTNGYYAVTPQLVLSEAFAYKKTEQTQNGAKYVNEGYAIEIYNPTNHNINLSGYRLAVSGVQIQLPSALLKPDDKFVLCWAQTYDNKGTKKSIDASRADFNFKVDGTSGRAIWKTSPTEMKFKGGQICLSKVVKGGKYLPADHIDIMDSGRAGARQELTFDSNAADSASRVFRDNNWYRGRSTIAMYGRSNDKTHTLGSTNTIDTNTKNAMDSISKYSAAIWTKGSHASGLGDLCNIYFCALKYSYSAPPTVFQGTDADSDFPHMIVSQTNNRLFENKSGIGRLSLTATSCSLPAAWGRLKETYPNLPTGCLLGDFMTMTQPVAKPKFGGTTSFGLVNINTASGNVLKSLIYKNQIFCPMYAQHNKYQNIMPNRTAVADAILKYRDEDKLGYRGQAKANCFLADGEVAIPISKYLYDTQKSLFSGAQYHGSDDPRLDWRFNILVSQLYNQLSGTVTTRSDTFGIYITVSGLQPQSYYGIISRLEATDGQPPKVIMFTKVKN